MGKKGKSREQWSSSRSATVCVLLFAAAAANGAKEHEGPTATTEHEYLYDCPDTAPQKARNDDVPDVSADSLLVMALGGVGGIVF